MPYDLPQQLLDNAMRLPDGQRAALAAASIESLDHVIDADAKAAASAVIARRRAEVERGRSVRFRGPMPGR